MKNVDRDVRWRYRNKVYRGPGLTDKCIAQIMRGGFKAIVKLEHQGHVKVLLEHIVADVVAQMGMPLEYKGFAIQYLRGERYMSDFN